MRQNEKDQAYAQFVKHGGLVRVRSFLESAQECIKVTVSKNEFNGWESLFWAYLNQLKFDSLLNSELVYKWMLSETKKRNVLRLPVPIEWIDTYQAKSKSKQIRARQAKVQYFGRILSLQIKSIGKVFIVLLNQKEKIGSVDISQTNQVNVIGHVNYSYVSKEANESEWTYYAWLNKGKTEKIGVNFLTEMSLMKLILTTLAQSERFFGIKLKLRVLRRSLKKIRESNLSISNCIIGLDQLVFAEITSLFAGSLSKCNFQFTESIGCKRPFWTYIAEQHESKIELQFFASYATLSTKIRIEFPPQFFLYTWRRINAVSRWQERSLPRINLLGEKVDVRNSSIPWFQDDSSFGVSHNEKYLAVFNYEGRRNHFGSSTLNDLELTHPACSIKFLQDILDACHDSGFRVYFKQKRAISKESQLFDLSKSFANNMCIETLKFLPQAISPHRLISNARGVISLPPTSTGLIGQQMGKPSVYFDPFGAIKTDDPALDGILVIQSKRDLENWIRSLD